MANDIAVQRGFQVFTGAEVVRLQHLLDPSVETLDHAIGLGVLRRCEAVLDAEVAAQQVELVLAGGSTFAQTEQTVSELLAVIRCPAGDCLQSVGRQANDCIRREAPRGGQHRPDVDRAGPFQVA